MTISLRERQSKFARLVADLIIFAYNNGYEITFGDAFATSGHCENSYHYKRLAIDLNLFKNGKYLIASEAHKPLGTFWKSLDPECSWGGDWQDGNHYSYGEK